MTADVNNVLTENLPIRFYLSFENSICEDYATEKFFNALKSDIVPVSSSIGRMGK